MSQLYYRAVNNHYCQEYCYNIIKHARYLKMRYPSLAYHIHRLNDIRTREVT